MCEAHLFQTLKKPDAAKGLVVIVLVFTLQILLLAQTVADGTAGPPLSLQVGRSELPEFPVLHGKRLFSSEVLSLDAKSDTGTAGKDRVRSLSDTITDTSGQSVDQSVDQSSDSAMPIHDVADRQRPSSDHQTQSTSTSTSTSTLQLRYDARISSGALVRIVVNGMTCRAVSWQSLRSRASGQVLRCPGVIARDLELYLLPDGRQVRVLQRLAELGVLQPGQAL